MLACYLQYPFGQVGVLDTARQHQGPDQGRHDHQALVGGIFSFEIGLYLRESGIEHRISGGTGLPAQAQFR